MATMDRLKHGRSSALITAERDGYYGQVEARTLIGAHRRSVMATMGRLKRGRSSALITAERDGYYGVRG
jgi:hypothetical protein